MLSLVPGVTVLATALAGAHSVLLAVSVLLLTPAVLTPLVHNYERLGARLREENDRLVLEDCESGKTSGFRRIYRHLPADPRCRLCLVPFGGLGRLLRVKPSRKNPNFCSSCIDSAPVGVYEMDVGVLVADIRGFTAWSSSQPAAAAARRVSEFYESANRVLMKDDALVEFVGDQVMALYLPGFPSLGGHTADTMLRAARRLVSEVQPEQARDPLRIGVGIHFGAASVGNVRKGHEKDFTAVGDAVNTAARLQAVAGPGEIVVGEAAFERLSSRPERAERRLLEIKGKSQAVPAYFVSTA